MIHLLYSSYHYVAYIYIFIQKNWLVVGYAATASIQVRSYSSDEGKIQFTSDPYTHLCFPCQLHRFIPTRRKLKVNIHTYNSCYLIALHNT